MRENSDVPDNKTATCDLRVYLLSYRLYRTINNIARRETIFNLFLSFFDEQIAIAHICVKKYYTYIS